MKLNIKDYKIVKMKEYFKSGNLFFFVNGLNQNSLDWLRIEQELKTIGFSYYKVLNKTTIKTLNTSIYTNINPVIKGSTFLIKPQKTKRFSKQTTLKTFNSLFFELLVVKFNNKIYSANALKSTYSLEYKETKLLLYQFNLTHLKTYSEFSK
jgi:hypothetical protein